MSNKVDKKQSKQIEETEESIEGVNWPVVIPLLLVMIGIFIVAFIALY